MTSPGVIRVDRTFNHPPSLVWKALTDPALHARWWAAGDVRPVVGHRFELDMGNWGMRPCEVTAVENERLLSYSFAGMSQITWRLEPNGAGTRLMLTHDGFDLDDPMGRAACEGMGKGWPSVIARIDDALATAS